jgi:hypothetical protein
MTQWWQAMSGRHYYVDWQSVAVYYSWVAAGSPGRAVRGLQSSTFRLHLRTFCGIRGVYQAVSVTKTSQVELRSGRVLAPEGRAV